MNLNQMTILI